MSPPNTCMQSYINTFNVFKCKRNKKGRKKANTYTKNRSQMQSSLSTSLNIKGVHHPNISSGTL